MSLRHAEVQGMGSMSNREELINAVCEREGAEGWQLSGLACGMG